MIAGEDGAVQDFCVRVCGALTDAGVEENGRCGKNDVVSIGDELLNDRFGVRLRNIFAANRFYARAERILKSLSAQLMPIGPAGILRRTVIEERTANLLGRSAPDGLQKPLLLFGRVGEKHGGFVCARNDELRPDACNLLLKFVGAFIDAVVVTKDLQIGQQRVAGGHGRL